MSTEIQRYLLATETTSEGYGMAERDVTRAKLHPSEHGNVVLFRDHQRVVKALQKITTKATRKEPRQ